MKKLQFEIEKAGKSFTITHKQNGFGSCSIEIEGPNLYETGDTEYDSPDEKKEKITGGFEEDKVKFRFAYFLHEGKKINGFTLDSQICAQIRQNIEEDKNAREADKNDREHNRTAPYLDRSKFEVYNVGCDTGLIYHSNKKAIYLAIENGAKQYDVLRGERDNSNKFPGQMDDFIPVDFAEKVEGKHTALGYTYIYAEHYCISKEDYDRAVAEIEAEKADRENALQSKFEEASRTGTPVIISKTTMAEEDSPLAADGEGDIVDAVTYAMPDGTKQTKYFHNY